MDASYTESPRLSIVKDKWERSVTAKLVSDFESRNQIVSQRDFAESTNVPRSTLRYWLSRKDGIDADPFLVELFENPTGVAFFHRLVTTAHLCFTKEGTASIHNVSDFLEKSGLSHQPRIKGLHLNSGTA